MEKFLTIDKARRILARGRSVYAVTLDDKSRARIVEPIRMMEALEAFLDFYGMVDDDQPELMSLTQLLYVSNVFVSNGVIEILVPACDV